MNDAEAELELSRRTVALQEAVKSCTPNQERATILARAIAFERFLKGEA